MTHGIGLQVGSEPTRPRREQQALSESEPDQNQGSPRLPEPFIDPTKEAPSERFVFSRPPLVVCEVTQGSLSIRPSTVETDSQGG
jgi:hypothetical protein